MNFATGPFVPSVVGRCFTGIYTKRGQSLWADLETFIQRGSLASIADQLRDNPKVHILHNADDFLSDRKSIDELKDILGDRVTLYPYGGHLGNLWYPENKEYAFNFFGARPRTEIARAHR